MDAKRYKYEEQSLTLAELLALPACSLTAVALRKRLNKPGVIVKDAVEKPLGKEPLRYRYGDASLTKKEIHALPECSISIHTLNKILSRKPADIKQAIANVAPRSVPLTFKYCGVRLTVTELHELPTCTVSRDSLYKRLLRGTPVEQAVELPAKGCTPQTVRPAAPRKPLRTHNYKGRQLTRRQLSDLLECLPEVTEKHISVRMALGWEAEKAITTPLRKEATFVATMRIHTAKARERKRIQAIMAVPVRPKTTSAYYTLAALEARKKLDQITKTLGE